MKRKIKLFTHNDLDGIGCYIVLKTHYFINTDIVDVTYCDYNDIDLIVSDFVENKKYNEYEKVYITDISVSKETAIKIEEIHSKQPGLFKLIDHHATAKWLNSYSWAYVNDMENSFYSGERQMKSCGTTLLYDHLTTLERAYLCDLDDFVEKVRRYDTWEWNTRFNDTHAKQLNDLFFLLGREAFIERFLNDSDVNFTDGELMLLEAEQRRIDSYIERKAKQMFESAMFFDKEYIVGVVFAEQYQSQLGNYLATINKHLDFIVLIDVGEEKVSYRGVHNSIDIGEAVKVYGGGGHPKTAGSQTESSIKELLWNQFVVKHK